MMWGAVDVSREVKSAVGPHGAAAGTDTELAQRLAELEQLRHAEIAQARRSAFEEGLRKAREEAAAEVKASGERLAQTIRDLGILKKRIRNEAEAEVVRLSLAVARRILHRELTLDPESIEGLVHAALRTLENREVSRVRVCPASAEAVRAILTRGGAEPGIEVAADNKMGIGDIVFETSVGQLDASIDTQLQEIQRGFTDRLGTR